MAFSIKQQKDTNVLDEVTATSVLTDNAIVRGDGGAKGVQTSLVSIDDNGSINIPTGQSYKINNTALAYTNITNALGSSAVLTDNYLIRGDGGARGSQTSLILVGDDGTVTLPNAVWLRTLNYAGTGYLNVFKGNTDDEIDVGSQLNVGTIEAEEDAGRISIFDMPVSSASADGTQMSATSKIDGNNVFEIGAYADGAGGVDGEYIKSYGAIYRNVTTVNAATYDLLASDDILNVTYTATGAVTSLTLPTAQCVSGRVIVIKDAGGLAGTNNITISTEGAEKIDGLDTLVINNNYNSVTLYSDGTNWFAI